MSFILGFILLQLNNDIWIADNRAPRWHQSSQQRAMDVKIRELPSWKLMQDFTPKGIVGVFLRGWYYISMSL